MGRISGWLWIVGAVVGTAGSLPSRRLPSGRRLGAHAQRRRPRLRDRLRHRPDPLAARLDPGPGDRHAALTVPVVGVAIYVSGGSISYVEPLLVCALLYAALFFPARWAWPLAIEVVIVAAAPLVYEHGATATAFPSRYLAIAATFLTLTGVMVALKRRLVEAEARQREIANRDPLTGIANRRAFDSAMRQALATRVDSAGRRRGDDEPFALLVIDLDDFKAINDEYGHPVGDAVLRQTAQRARSVLRSTDVLARIGGDEFAVLAPGAHGESAERMGESIAAAIANREPDSRTPLPHASLGLAVFPEDGETFEGLMRTADQRLLSLKAGGSHFSPRGETGTLRLI